MFKVSKYNIDLNAFDGLVLTAINSAIKNCDLIVIDEIGKMELLSERFQETVAKGLNSRTPVVGTMGMIDHPFVKLLKSRSDIHILTLNRENREHVYREICNLMEIKTI
jgi:nucleoside-triphosphatase